MRLEVRRCLALQSPQSQRSNGQIGHLQLKDYEVRLVGTGRKDCQRRLPLLAAAPVPIAARPAPMSFAASASILITPLWICKLVIC